MSTPQIEIPNFTDLGVNEIIDDYVNMLEKTTAYGPIAFSSATALAVGILIGKPKWGAALAVANWANVVGTKLAVRYLKKKIS